MTRKELNLKLMKEQWIFSDMTKVEISIHHKCGVTTVERRCREGRWGLKKDKRKHTNALKVRCLNMLEDNTFCHVERVTGVSRPTLHSWWEEVS